MPVSNLDFHSICSRLESLLDFQILENDVYLWHYGEEINTIKNETGFLWNDLERAISALALILPCKGSYDTDGFFDKSGILWFNSWVSIFEETDILVMLINEGRIEYKEQPEIEATELWETQKKLRAKYFELRESGFYIEAEKVEIEIEQTQKKYNKRKNIDYWEREARLNSIKSLSKLQILVSFSIVMYIVFHCLELENALTALVGCADELQFFNSLLKKRDGTSPTGSMHISKLLGQIGYSDMVDRINSCYNYEYMEEDICFSEHYSELLLRVSEMGEMLYRRLHSVERKADMNGPYASLYYYNGYYSRVSEFVVCNCLFTDPQVFTYLTKDSVMEDLTMLKGELKEIVKCDKHKCPVPDENLEGWVDNLPVPELLNILCLEKMKKADIISMLQTVAKFELTYLELIVTEMVISSCVSEFLINNSNEGEEKPVPAQYL